MRAHSPLDSGWRSCTVSPAQTCKHALCRAAFRCVRPLAHPTTSAAPRPWTNVSLPCGRPSFSCLHREGSQGPLSECINSFRRVGVRDSVCAVDAETGRPRATLGHLNLLSSSKLKVRGRGCLSGSPVTLKLKNYQLFQNFSNLPRFGGRTR